MNERLQPAAFKDTLPEPSGRPSSLPLDVVDSATRRLRFLAVLVAVLVVVNGILIPLLSGNEMSNAAWARALASEGSAVLLSTAMVAFVRRRTLNGRQTYIVGLAYMAAIIVMVASPRHMGDNDIIAYGWTGASVAIMLFPVLIPCSPRRALLAGFTLWASNALAYCLAIATGKEPYSLLETLAMFRSEMVAIPVSAAVAGVVHSLGRKISHARQMGSYELIEKLGAGGMGEVWKGRHGMLARPAAIKLVLPKMLESRSEATRRVMLERFRREAEATAQMRSPHTIELFDFGLADGGTFYYVMEFLDGVDLEKAVRVHGAMPPARAVHLLKQIAHSLDEAHAAGLIHRDIKPANIQICRYGQDLDFVKVLDFGLVKDVTPQGSGADLTIDGAFAGTPAFAAPEQIRGQEVDARSDIYAFGCVAYWLLARRFVFDVGTVADLVAAHLREMPEPLGDRVKDMPPALDELIMDCLEKDPHARPQNFAEIRHQLDSLEVPRWTRADAEAWWSTMAEREAAHTAATTRE